ncbi:hypothetical protein ACGRHY_00575 [Streptomyces sp. HK10]|uniref:hypothetical protein n=1 Tax=Streptomyces sp. HK10 TaxID=3373255 RepID=UPI003747E83C
MADGTPGPDGTGSDGPVPYREETEDRYADDYASGLRVLSADNESVVLSGRCPRCGCACTYLHVRRVFRRIRREPRERWVPVMCTCAADHPGRPAGEEGCGAYWNVVLEWR